MFNSEVQDQQRIIMAIMKIQDYVQHIRHVDQFRQVVELLLRGILSPQLVSKPALRINLMAIRSHLERYFPNFALIFDRASPFYTLREYFFGRHVMRLLIQIQIPLTTFQHEFTVYEVINYPVPVTGRPTYKTFLPPYRVILSPAYTAIFYFTLQNDDTKRHPKLLYLTDSRISFSPFITGATCLSALYRNNMTQVHELCSFQLQEAP